VCLQACAQACCCSVRQGLALMIVPNVLCQRAAADGTPYSLALHRRPMRSGLRRAAQRPGGRLAAAIGGTKAVCCLPSWQAGLVNLAWICGMHFTVSFPLETVCMPASCSVGPGQGPALSTATDVAATLACVHSGTGAVLRSAAHSVAMSTSDNRAM